MVHHQQTCCRSSSMVVAFTLSNSESSSVSLIRHFYAHVGASGTNVRLKRHTYAPRHIRACTKDSYSVSPRPPSAQ